MNLKKAAVISIVTAAILYVAYLLLLFFGQGSMIYPRTRDSVGPAPPHEQGAEPLRIATREGNVDALYLPATTGGAEAGREPVVIFAHGNGEVIDYWPAALHGFRERGIGVLLVEYPGYGRSTGKPSERSIRAVMDAAYDRIAADPRVDRTRIIGFGQSLGGGAICLLSQGRPLRALILQSTFPSLDIFATSHWAPAFLLRDHFDSLSALRQFHGPVLV